MIILGNGEEGGGDGGTGRGVIAPFLCSREKREQWIKIWFQVREPFSQLVQRSSLKINELRVITGWKPKYYTVMEDLEILKYIWKLLLAMW